MATIVLLGASGLTGRLTAAELVRRGHRPVLAAPDRVRLHARVGEDIAAMASLREVDATQPGELEPLLDAADLVINLAGPYARHGRVVLDAALRAGVDYLDAALEPDAVAWVHQQDDRARAAGRVVVPAAGFPSGVLDLLSEAALGAVTGADEVHLATTFPSRRPLARATSATTRVVLASLLEQRMTVRCRGTEVAEPVAEARRLAWFPRPVGLAHAAGVPGSAHLSVPRHAPDVVTVREYLAVSSWQAELLQMAGNATRWAWARRRLGALVRGGGGEPPEIRRGEVRWACVAETRGAEGVARAWANGLDPAATAAASLVVVAEAVLRGTGEPGVRAVAELAPAADLLDRLGARHDLRWAVLRPA